MTDNVFFDEIEYLLNEYERVRGPVVPAPPRARRPFFPSTKQRVRCFKRILIQAGRLNETVRAGKKEDGVC